MIIDRTGPDRRKKSGFLRSVVERYRAIKRALSEPLGRRESEYSRLIALSQELARLRSKIKAELTLCRQRRPSRPPFGG
jgi:hypothetical protein